MGGTSLPTLDLLLDAAWGAPWNMARDEALLIGDRTVLRRTLWRRPAVTIGRFQPWQLMPRGAETLAPIRRITGGGAIFHGEDLTLALVAPLDCPIFPSRSPRAIAERVSAAIAEALHEHLPEARVRGGESTERAQRTVLDCFERRTPFDLVSGKGESPEKIGGLALHRRRDRILVQGSIVRGDELPGEQDQAFLESLAAALGAETQRTEELVDHEEDLSWALCESRYGNATWNRKIRESS